MQVFYQVEEWGHCDDPADWIECDTACTSLSDGRWIAQDCAKDLFHNHDGWEASWPLTILVYDAPYEEGLMGKFLVDLETVPEFYASEVTD